MLQGVACSREKCCILRRGPKSKKNPAKQGKTPRAQARTGERAREHAPAHTRTRARRRASCAFTFTFTCTSTSTLSCEPSECCKPFCKAGISAHRILVSLYHENAAVLFAGCNIFPPNPQHRATWKWGIIPPVGRKIQCLQGHFSSFGGRFKNGVNVCGRGISAGTYPRRSGLRCRSGSGSCRRT